MSDQAFQERCRAYLPRLLKITNPTALKKLQWHQAQGHTVVILSASIDSWITPWASTYDVETVIASHLEVHHGRVTGKLKGQNCHGEEKVKRFLAAFPNRESYTLYMYGDGKSDQAMFDRADHFFLKRFS